jgi:hypothetical protein
MFNQSINQIARSIRRKPLILLGLLALNWVVGPDGAIEKLVGGPVRASGFTSP